MKKLLAVFILLTFSISLFSQVTISEVYAGGGNSGAPYQNDYVVLFNAGSGLVSLSGWSIQYAPATTASWSVVTLSGTIPSNSYFLIQLGNAGGTPTGAALIAPDVVSSTPNMNITGGKVALMNSTTALTTATGNATAPSVVDFIGWGSATDFEGTSAAPAQTNTKAVCRVSGASDTNDNGADFMLLSPTPRNSSVVLSVEINAFTCQTKYNMHQLSWQTASEKDNVYFDIQYASDGKSFQTIGQVQGKNTTGETKNYAFEHLNPSLGTSYYRLRQVDLDGHESFSKIISAQLSSKKTLKVFPTLATDKLVISVDTEGGQIYNVFDLLGRNVQTGQLFGQKELTVNDLSKGTYILKVGEETVKFFKN